MEQGSNEWLQWRKQGIGASEAAILLGLDPYGKTPYKLWLEKQGAPAEDTEAAPGLFQRGHETEAMIRAALELETGVDYPPALFEHPEYPFIRASLDGWADEEAAKNACLPRGMECKMVGIKALAEPIPPHHQAQLQHQMLVTAQDEWLYVRHAEGTTQKFTVKADPRMQTQILAACWDFWDRVTTQIAPAFTDQDWVPVENENLDLALRMMLEQNTTTKRAPYRAEALALAAGIRAGNRLENMMAGPAHGAKVQLNPARVTLPKP
jgi:putative phage-type endonuclease